LHEQEEKPTALFYCNIRDVKIIKAYEKMAGVFIIILNNVYSMGNMQNNVKVLMMEVFIIINP